MASKQNIGNVPERDRGVAVGRVYVSNWSYRSWRREVS